MFVLKNKFIIVSRTACCAPDIGIKCHDYVLYSCWSLSYSPKQETDISYEADCYTKNKIIGVNEYDAINRTVTQQVKTVTDFKKISVLHIPARLYAFK